MTSTTELLPEPQQQRSVESRRRLLEATLACLVERGHAATTTTEVAKRAELSQGALYKHFPSKALLLGAAAEHLFGQLVVGFRVGFSGLAEEAIVDVEARLRAALELLWGVFDAPLLAAALELYVAARTDAELAATLVPALAAHTDNLFAEAQRLFPEVADHPSLPGVVAGVISAMQGAAVIAHLTHHERERAFLEHVVVAEFRRMLEDAS